MSMFKVFDISGSAVSAQSQRLNVVASNLANVDTVAGPDGQAYKARQVVFQTLLMGASGSAVGADPGDPVSASAGVRVSNISEDQTPGRKVRDPGHPAADAEALQGLAETGRLFIAGPDAGPVPLVLDVDPGWVTEILAELGS